MTQMIAPHIPVLAKQVTEYLGTVAPLRRLPTAYRSSEPARWA